VLDAFGTSGRVCRSSRAGPRARARSDPSPTSPSWCVGQTCPKEMRTPPGSPGRIKVCARARHLLLTLPNPRLLPRWAVTSSSSPSLWRDASLESLRRPKFAAGAVLDALSLVCGWRRPWIQDPFVGSAHRCKCPLRRGATVACVSIVNVSYVTSYARYGTLLSRRGTAFYRPRQQAHASATKRCVAAAAVGTCEQS
jgi:hypothetical protein